MSAPSRVRLVPRHRHGVHVDYAPRILQQTPGYSIAEVRGPHEFEMKSPFKVAGVTESLIRGLRLAGLPE